MGATEDRYLAKAAAAGNQHAFARLVDRYQNTVCCVALAVAGNVEASEEIAQDAHRGLGEPAGAAQSGPIRTLASSADSEPGS